MKGKAFHMHFINDGPGKWTFQRHVALPVITMGIRNYTFHGALCIVAGIESCIAMVVFRNHDPFAIGIQQDLIRIKAKSFGGIKGAMGTIGIYLAGLDVG